MKVLLIPDIHLGKGTNIGKDPVGVGLNSRIEDQKNLLDFITKYVKENDVKHIFLMGDIWDHVNPKSSVVNLFYEWLREITNPTTVTIILGNHDFTRSGDDKVSMLDSLDILSVPYCQVMREPEQFLYYGINFIILPFMDRKQLKKNSQQESISYLKNKLIELKKYPKHFNQPLAHVVLGHLCLEGSLWVGDEIDEESNEIFCPLNIFNGCNHVWMGHVHKPQILKNTKEQIIGHVGSLDKTAFTGPDSTEKSMVLLEWDEHKYDKTNLKHSIIPLPTRPLVAIDITVHQDCKDITAFVCNEVSKINVKDAIVRISIKLSSYDSESVDKNKLMTLLNKSKMFHLSSYKEYRPVKKVIVKNAEVDETITPEKGIKIFVDNLKEDDTFKSNVLSFCKKIIQEVKS